MSKRLEIRTPVSAANEMLENVLDFPTAENLSSSYDLLKLIGLVVGHITLLQAAVGPDPKAAVAAARALVSLKEDPDSVAERLKAGPFASLTTEDLRRVVNELSDGSNPRQVLERVVAQKREAS
jgi:hypothetical protein